MLGTDGGGGGEGLVLFGLYTFGVEISSSPISRSRVLLKSLETSYQNNACKQSKIDLILLPQES